MRRGKHFRRSIVDPSEAVSDALRYRDQALRLKNALDKALLDHSAEVRRLRRDLEFAYESNANLVFEITYLRHSLSQNEGDA